MEECPICYEDMPRNQILKAPCQHSLCVTCAGALRKTECPFCRTSLKESVAFKDFIKPIEEREKEDADAREQLNLRQALNMIDRELDQAARLALRVRDRVAAAAALAVARLQAPRGTSDEAILLEMGNQMCRHIPTEAWDDIIAQAADVFGQRPVAEVNNDDFHEALHRAFPDLVCPLIHKLQDSVRRVLE